MNCEQANQIDLVDYLHSAGHEPSKIRGNDYWYHSPLRDEKEPSFKLTGTKMSGMITASEKEER